jgi:hypothetical protein
VDAQGVQEAEDRFLWADLDAFCVESRFTYSWPSGKRSVISCAQCSANAVLPTPAIPLITITVVCSGAARWVGSAAPAAARAVSRPTKTGRFVGSCAGRAGGANT